VDEGYERRREEYQRWLQQDPTEHRPPRGGSLDGIFEALLEEALEGLVEGVLEGTIEGWLGGALPGGHGQTRTMAGGGQTRILNSYYEAGSEERSCSPPNTGGVPPLPHKRTKPGAVYAVDPLTAAITDAFMAALAEEPAALREGIGEEEIARKGEIFRRVVRAVHRQGHPGPDAIERLPPALKGKVHKRGALVLFPEPFPVIQRCPKASFLGYLRVDGDLLLAEVAGTVGTPNRLVKVPYYLEREAGRPLTKAQLQAYLARELGVNQKLAGDFIDVLCDKAAAELEDGLRFVLSSFGSLAPEPNGQVTFSAYKALRDRLGTPGEGKG
jgi:hypothetical protein